MSNCTNGVVVFNMLFNCINYPPRIVPKHLRKTVMRTLIELSAQFVAEGETWVFCEPGGKMIASWCPDMR